MRFYDRKKELAILQDIEQQSFDNAAFTVMMGRRKNRKNLTHHACTCQQGVCLPFRV